MGTTSTQPVCAQWGPTLLNVSLTFSNCFDLADVSTTYFVPLVMITLGHNRGNSCDAPSYTLVSLVQKYVCKCRISSLYTTDQRGGTEAIVYTTTWWHHFAALCKHSGNVRRAASSSPWRNMAQNKIPINRRHGSPWGSTDRRGITDMLLCLPPHTQKGIF